MDWVRRPIALVALCWLWCSAAQAQVPTVCAPPQAGEFTKSVCVVDSRTDACAIGRPLPLQVRTGDVLEYEVVRCNGTGMSCFSTLSDNLDGLLPGRTNRLEFLPFPTTECGSPSSLGGAICQQGPRAGPWTTLTSTQLTTCGQNCSSPNDQLFLAPKFSTNLPDGQCYRFRFRATVGPSMATECLCNQARVVTDLMGGSAPSHHPEWVSLDGMDPGEVGCTDTATCPDPTACGTCVKLSNTAVLAQSSKCIDTRTPCGDGLDKNPGDPISYLFSICNTGGLAAGDVAFDDPLDFLSSLGTPCIDVTGSVQLQDLACDWLGGTCDSSVNVRWDQPTATLVGTVTSLPPEACVTFELAATVDTAVDGGCTNAWNLVHGGPTPTVVPVNAPVFTSVGGTGLTGTKCLDDGVGMCEVSAAPLSEEDPVAYIIEFTNTGAVTADGVMLSDDVPPCVAVTPGSPVCVPASPACGSPFDCVAGFSPPSSVTATVPPMAPGCTVRLTFAGTVAPGATSPCCNDAAARWELPVPSSSASGPICFDVAAPGIRARKLVDGQPSVLVAPLAMKTFTVTVDNLSTTDLTGCRLDDDVAAGLCMTLDTMTGCGSVPDLGTGLDCGVMTPERVVATFDLARGARQVVTIPVIAGSNLGRCANQVDVSCNALSDSAQASLEISDALCELNREILSPPIVRTAPWAYTRSCAVSDLRIVGSLLISPPPSTPMDTADPADPGPGGELRLYQLGCGCDEDIKLVKTTLQGGFVRLTY